MNFDEFCETVRDVDVTDKLFFRTRQGWPMTPIPPQELESIGACVPVVKIPGWIKDAKDRRAPVVTVAKDAFAGKTFITDIVLPYPIWGLPDGAFAGCVNLRNVTLPRGIRRIKENTFAGCVDLENIFYEGTPEEWKKIEVVHEQHEIELGDLIPGRPVHYILAERNVIIPGNEAMFAANVHFRCDLRRLL